MFATIIITLLLLIPNVSYAVTVTFQEGVSSYAGTKDAEILSFSTNEHLTNATSIRSLTANGFAYILYFDISTIPITATVTSATVQLYVSEQNCTAETAGVRAIQNPDNSGAFAANTASADVFNQYATWRYKNETGTVKWSTSGGSSNFTDVYGATDEDTQSISACAAYAAKTWTITNMVQGWVTNPSSNSGMTFNLASTGNVSVRNRFYATSAERPLLTVTYTDSVTPSYLTVGTPITINGSVYVK